MKVLKAMLVPAVLAVLCGSAAPAGEQPPPAPKTEERRPQAVFQLVDGSRVVGETSIKEVPIKTAYGDVVIPAADVVRIRVARSSDKTARDKVAALIKQLGAPNFDDREKAYDDLCKLGPVALAQLQEAAKHPDAEVRSRVEKLLAELDRGGDDEAEAEEGPLVGDEDELVAKRFTLRGVIKVEKFELKTRYGTLEIPREDVLSAMLSRPDAVSKTVKVMGQHTFNSMVGTGLRVRQGDKLVVKASGSINFRNWGESSGPDGNQDRFGTQGPNNLPGMALCGRIGANGKPFLLGSAKQLTAEGDGELFLGLAFTNNTGNSNGEYKVVVTATPRGK
jgi:hypothetical protein